MMYRSVNADVTRDDSVASWRACMALVLEVARSPRGGNAELFPNKLLHVSSLSAVLYLGQDLRLSLSTLYFKAVLSGFF